MREPEDRQGAQGVGGMKNIGANSSRLLKRDLLDWKLSLARLRQAAGYVRL